MGMAVASMDLLIIGLLAISVAVVAGQDVQPLTDAASETEVDNGSVGSVPVTGGGWYYPDEVAAYAEGEGSPAWTVINKRTLRMLNPTSVTFGHKLRNSLRESKELAAAQAAAAVAVASPQPVPVRSTKAKAYIPPSRSHLQRWLDFNRIQ
ncbi:uncharacterized protein LOC129595238 isoform X2 [Paramacrobiotus metropolitanus]|uniref:uncharacterized protein LOC129595238 isoform X2 n=1 Tax=Paramacrobiotus metropolitanus TaxID=2943436 RepID=UPI0024460D5B|nr:uncharacterized protein LOC129595238 isoform X2 [Paramacrobiotus metropolitanus]